MSKTTKTIKKIRITGTKITREETDDEIVLDGHGSVCLMRSNIEIDLRSMSRWFDERYFGSKRLAITNFHFLGTYGEER